jgi:hypothetical protein
MAWDFTTEPEFAEVLDWADGFVTDKVCEAGHPGPRRALGTTHDMPLTRMLASGLLLGLADGPTEVHQATVATQVLRGYKPADGPWPTEFIPARRAEAAAKLLGEELIRTWLPNDSG